MTIWTPAFRKALLERVLWTLAQVVVGFGTAFLANGATFSGWDWKNTLVAIIVSTVSALIKGIAANAVTKTGPGTSPSEQVVPPEPQPKPEPQPIAPE
jgi:hypothetical protein